MPVAGTLGSYPLLSIISVERSKTRWANYHYSVVFVHGVSYQMRAGMRPTIYNHPACSVGILSIASSVVVASVMSGIFSAFNSFVN